MRPPALPEIAAARAELTRRSSTTAAEFKVDETKNAKTPVETDKAGVPESFKRFEATVLQTFIQNMLPKDGAAVYGKGMAGDMWKSLLAENLAKVMAERGGIGIADRMLGAHYAAKATPGDQVVMVSEAIAPESANAAESRFRVAPSVLDGMQRSLAELLANDPVLSSQASVQPTTKRG